MGKQETEATDELASILDRIRAERKKENLSQYERDLLEWSRNVDRRFAWVVLLAQWLIVFATLGTYRMYGLFYVKIVEEGYYSREQVNWPTSMIGTFENLSGPFVSVLAANYISCRQSTLLGGLLFVVANGLAAFSSTLLLDTVLVGVVQGIGYGLIYTLLMEVSNSYFVRYRGMAMGVALSGATIGVFALEPLFKWLLEAYPWRWSYLAVAAVNALIIPAALLLKPHPRPERPEPNPEAACDSAYQSQASIVTLSGGGGGGTMTAADAHKQERKRRSAEMWSNIWLVLRTPAFHLIWYLNLLFFWISSTYMLAVADYGLDRGFSHSQAEALLELLSVGEILGRIGFGLFLDMGLLSARQTSILNLMLMGVLLAAITQATSFVGLAACVLLIAATYAFINILVCRLLVDYLGERQATLGFGLASFIGGPPLLLRPQVVGYFRDQMGSYDLMMLSMGGACTLAALLWVLEPPLTRLFSAKRSYDT